MAHETAGAWVWARAAVFMLGLAPLARWIGLGLTEGLGANPVEFLTRESGTWALICLLVTLAITPLRQGLGWPALVRVRRMCGLFAFFYASLHWLAYLWWDRAWALASIVGDVVQRPFIAVGLAAYTLMAVLACTSTRGWMRRLGRNWQRVHRIVYAVGILAILHLVWHKAGKNDFDQAVGYGAVLALLLGWRLTRAWQARQAAAAARTGAR